MKLSSKMRVALVKEIRFAVDNMKQSQKPTDKMYFFSAVYGMLQRVFNFEYDPELVFIHQVVHQAFDAINNRINLGIQKDVPSSIPENLFEKLQNYLSELADNIESDKKTYDILEKISVLGYSTIGNGLYLLIKNDLKI
jgi:hypothetical protein